MAEKSSIVRELETARSRGIEFLLAQQRDDGSMKGTDEDGIGPYYKTLWALVCAGRPAEANRLCTWIAREPLTSEGDFRGRFRGPNFDHNYVYPNAWIIVGAHKLGRYDLSIPAMRYVLTRQDESGGFYMDRDKPQSEIDILNACMGGNACLITGHMGEAMRVARFLRMVFDAQPDPTGALWYVYQPGHGVVTETPEGAKPRNYSVDATRPRQGLCESSRRDVHVAFPPFQAVGSGRSGRSGRTWRVAEAVLRGSRLRRDKALLGPTEE